MKQNITLSLDKDLIRKSKILAAQRSESMSMPLKWEFPGGKVDNGESPADCLKRELIEELGIEVDVGGSIPEMTYAYPDFSITLYHFFCKIKEGDIILYEHKSFSWLKPQELETLDWTEADLKLIENNIIK